MAISNVDNQIILRPNNSLLPEDAVKVIVALTIVVLLISLGFMHIGAFFVLPFAGLEVLAIAYAFRIVYLHSSDFESITIVDDSVVIEKRVCEQVSKTVFQRYWAQVVVRDVVRSNGLGGRSAIFISSHGKEVEFGGHFINDEERALLVRDLKQTIKQ
ncbi:hypothetical protein GALL_227400 [mine drainage metagenome]|uniref:DUF2244 domain-containing protein n=1 Tax=mine drainage metagenome TaxID=410659 RepID=A0A1J5RGN9_9ZZZZ